MSSLCVSDTKLSDWRYVSEGVATIVFSYIGHPHPQFDRTVLRVRKIPTHTSQVAIDADNNGQVRYPDVDAVRFQHDVIQRLIPEEYLPRLERVLLDRTWLEGLSVLNEPLRPLERRQKGRIDTARTTAVLATNVISEDGLTVEIKVGLSNAIYTTHSCHQPKWGFLPNTAHLSPKTLSVKSTTCRFCMHKYLRSKQRGGTPTHPGYCPLDLFSGDEVRMTNAIHGLWDAWLGSGGSINNLRIFVNGKMIKPRVGADVSVLLKISGSHRSLIFMPRRPSSCRSLFT